MKRMVFVVLIGLIAIAATNQRAVLPVKLFTYPVGSTPELISDTEIERGFVSAGFGVFGPNEELYFFDSFNNNIKVLDINTGTLLELIDGPASTRTRVYYLAHPDRLGPEHGVSSMAPVDMTVKPDGVPVLLIEDTSGSRFYRILQKRRGEPGWDEIAAPSKLGLGIRPNTVNCCIIDAAPDGEVYLYSREKHSSFSVTELQSPTTKERISAASEHTRAMNEKFPTGTPLLLHPTREYIEQMSLIWDEVRFGRVGWDGSFYTTRAISRTGKNTERTIRVKARGSLVGISRNGTVITSSGGYVQAVDPSGQAVAVGMRSHVPTEKLITGGHGSTLVSPKGKAIQLKLTREGLEAYLLLKGE